MDSLIHPPLYPSPADHVAIEIRTIFGDMVPRVAAAVAATTTTTTTTTTKAAAATSSVCSSSSEKRSGSGTMASEDDLEYHITFPAPTISSSPIMDDEDSRSAVDDCIYVDNEHKEPVVVLLGWYACEDRHLSKYSKIYEDMGCITMRFIPRPDLFLYQPDNMRSIASKLVELVVDFNLEEHPILIHMFSNGGCYVYRHICELINGDLDGDGPKASEKIRLNIRGCIFDSGPAINKAINFFRAIRDTTRGHVLYRWIRGGFLMLVVVIAFIVEYLLGFIWSERGRSAPLAMWECLTKDPLRCPQLFFYSKADVICSHKSIKSFIEERRKCGVTVFEACWDDSAHVKHLLVHRHEYVGHVVNFVETCLIGIKSLNTAEEMTNNVLNSARFNKGYVEEDVVNKEVKIAMDKDH